MEERIMDRALTAKPGQAVKVKVNGEWVDGIYIQTTMFHIKVAVLYNGEIRQINAEHHQVRDFKSRVGVPR
jgi:hypothetical protein